MGLTMPWMCSWSSWSCTAPSRPSSSNPLPACTLARTVKFSDWVQSRPDLKAALSAIQQNPGAALTPLPVAVEPTVMPVGAHPPGLSGSSLGGMCKPA